MVIRKLLRLLLTTLVWSGTVAVGYSQLSLPAIFGDSMVLQRNEPINIWGIARSSAPVNVNFAGYKAETKANEAGKWKLTLPAFDSMLPLQLVVESGNEKLTFHDILMGEVWICSGQSNMRWFLKHSVNGEKELSKPRDSRLRLFNMSSDIHPGPGAFDQAKLERLKNKEYYEMSGWHTDHRQMAAGFSAVAYYFGKHLMDSLQVPIGLIHNAVGGSTTESWIGREELKADANLKVLVDDKHPWPDVQGVNEWVKQRSRENMSLSTEQGSSVLTSHPFAPGYLYSAGIAPLVPLSVKGVIWYQGESNATFPHLHDQLLPLLISSWRKAWGQGDFPFLFVQLPNISNRNRWPEFRESQQRALNIPNTGMAVTIDSGDPGDVHPRNKLVVGNRLALVALQDVYSFNLESKGPTVSSYSLEENLLTVAFAHAKGMHTKDGQSPKGFVVQGYDTEGRKELLIRVEKVKIQGNSVLLEIPKSISPTKIKYAWSPNPAVNLYNNAGLPMVPFKLELPGNN